VGAEGVGGVASPLEVLEIESTVLRNILGEVGETLDGVADSSAATIVSTTYSTTKSELRLVLPSSSCD
jgi:hypothetical protein